MATICCAPNASQIGGDIDSIAGTANQVLVNGGTSAAMGAVTLSLPPAVVLPFDSTARLSISKNTSGQSAAVADGGTLLCLTGSNGAVADIVTEVYDNANSSGRWLARRAMGTFLVPLAITSDRTIFQFSARGYTGSAFSGGRANLAMETTENWSPTANGMRVIISTTPNGSTSQGTAATFGQDKSLTIAGTTEATTGGAGAILTPGGVYAAKKAYFAGGLLGTPTNNNAAAGCVGEYISSVVVSGSAVSLTTATAENVTSISLTAGDWDVTGVVDFILAAATATNFQGGSSATSATLGAQDSYVQVPLLTMLLSDTYGQNIPVTRFSLSATTTIYLVAQATFSAGTVTAYGTIRGRRVR